MNAGLLTQNHAETSCMQSTLRRKKPHVTSPAAN